MAYMVIAYIAMGYRVMAYTVMAYIVMAYIVMAYIVMAYIMMAYIVMAYIVMALYKDQTADGNYAEAGEQNEVELVEVVALVPIQRHNCSAINICRHNYIRP